MPPFFAIPLRNWDGQALQKHLAKMLLPRTFALYDGTDWEQAAAELQTLHLSYPSYYLVPHHGMKDGYLSYQQAAGWEAVEHLFRIPRVRPTVVQLAQDTTPQTIVDLGCGTALTSIEIACSLPQANLYLVDLSPYALVAARHQARQANVLSRVNFLHAAAEDTSLPANSADLVLISLLLHELPYEHARNVLREARRLLRDNGRLIIFDPIQCAFPWPRIDRAVNIFLMHLMHEVYWMEYATNPVWHTCQAAGFHHIERQLLFALPWIYQVVYATK
ncbi:methyltransferase type 11 [Dictyobacter vulcani]|uniref:Methyltransferase type 11 n=1 Tax=Dictyobacter vulcani TaxID=2607529 RepID=A0A5J4KXQ5_9CHLR|nr:class I SAM-dependent methyltransferase [Dictyobacter vulcani]GER91281.1 methyltransferase type 11 [Dictyobacter vulcani]